MKNSKYHSLYLREDEYARFHEEDPHVPTVEIKLPSLEEFFGLPWDEALKKVDGYGLAPEDQHFENYRELGFYKLPDKLKDIEDVVRDRLGKKDEENVYPQEIFDEIESDPIGYQEEIVWIERQQLRVENGVWIFIKGKPTFITGIHYAYLLCWPINNRNRKDRLAFYRDVDRRIFLYFQWAYTTKSAHFKFVMFYRNPYNGEVETRFFNTKSGADDWARSQGVSYTLEDWNQNVELQYRTLFGVVFPKRRRIGGTSQASFFCLMITLRRSMGQMAIQALTETTAVEDVYGKKILVPWKSFWFFFKPAHSPHDAKKLDFTPGKTSLMSKGIMPHNGRVMPRSSANKAFDGNELVAYLNDESGKKTEGDIVHEWRDTIRNTLAYGERIHGFACYVSTFGDFEKGGGRQFFDLCRQSYPDERDDNGQTQSGLAVMFIPAYDGFDNCIDMYGYSIIDDPPVPYKNLEGEMQNRGAKSILMATRRQLERARNWKGLNNEIRNNPWTLAEAHTKAVRSDSWNNVEKLREQISELRYGVPQTRRVNFRWSDGLSLVQRQHRSELSVVMVEDPNGPFEISLTPPEVFRSKCEWDRTGQYWRPAVMVMNKYVLGIDPFKYAEKDSVSKTKYLSKGAGVMKYKHDPVLDNPEEKDIVDWVSNRVILTYLHRPDTTEEFCEDMLKAAVFYGAMACVERNVDIVIQKWREWKFEGYLMHLLNPSNEQIEKVPGVYTSAHTHQKGFSYIQTHLKTHVKREKHLQLLEQVLDTEDFDDVTRNDLVAAWEMAEIGCANPVPEMLQRANSPQNFGPFIQLFG